MVKTVWEHTPGQAAGLREGDEVLAVGGVRVMRTAELVAAVHQHKPGTTVRLKLLRGGEPRTIRVTLAAKPPNSEIVRRHLLDKPAPALEGDPTAGTTSTLMGYRGDVVVVALFGTGCTSCGPVFTKLSALAKGQTRGLSVLGGVSGEHESAATVLSSRHALTFGLLAISVDTAVGWAWPDPTAPVIAVIDPRGVVRYAGTIDEGLSPEAAERAVAVEVDQAIFLAERLVRAARGRPR
jgi:peroxiredoxin